MNPIASYIDHTLLKPTVLISEIEQLCEEAITYEFAAVCVPPILVTKTREFIAGQPCETGYGNWIPVWLFGNQSKTRGSATGDW